MEDACGFFGLFTECTECSSYIHVVFVAKFSLLKENEISIVCLVCLTIVMRMFIKS